MECHCVPVGSGSHNYRLLPIKILLGCCKDVWSLALVRFCSPPLLRHTHIHTQSHAPFYSQLVFGHIERFLNFIFYPNCLNLVPLLGIGIALLLAVNSCPMTMLILWPPCFFENHCSSSDNSDWQGAVGVASGGPHHCP